MTTTTPAFRASGLASGIDTASIVDQLVALQRAPIDKLKKSQSIIDVQVSSLGSLKSQLNAFKSALKALADNGAHGVRVALGPTAADVTTTAKAQAGRTLLEVTQLAQAAKARTAALDPTAAMTAGTLHIDADGKGFDIAVTAGMSLSDVASAIKASGAPVNASVLNDGTHSFLSVSRTTTGFPIGSDPTTALVLSGSTATALGFAPVQDAKNALFSLDGLPFERRTNDVSDALPGVTLTLKQKTVVGTPQEIVLADDSTSTKSALQKVVDAYNAVVGAVQGELAIKPDTDRNKTLAGDPTMRMVQARMQSVVTHAVGAAGVRTLADLGLKSARDGTLSIDETAFNKVVAADPTAVDRIVSGLSPFADTLVSAFTDATNGALTVRSKGLVDKKKRMDDQINQLEDRADQYRERLVAQFAAMEKVVSGLKALGNFITSQENAKKSE